MKTSILLTSLIIAALASAPAAAESKNPLEKPGKITAPDSKGAGKATLPPPPADMPSNSDMDPPPLSSSLPGKGAQATPTDKAIQHLSAMRVVATVGTRAVLRGQLGRTGNLVPTMNGPADGFGGQFGQGQFGQFQGGGQFGQSQFGQPSNGVMGGQQGAQHQQDTKGVAERSLTVTDGENFQLADGMWLRPEVKGSSVRLYLQPSKTTKSEVLVYASGVEIANTVAAPLPDRSEDKKTDQATAK